MKILIACALLAVASAHSPVLMWPAEDFVLPDGESVMQMLDLEDFQKLFQNKRVVVFHKKSFAIEEVSYPDKPLTYLKNVDAIALQGVKSMKKFLSSLTSSSNLKSVELEGSLADQQDFMKKTMDENEGYAAILVGSGSHRSTREAPAASVCTPPENKDKCLFYVGAVIDAKTKQPVPCEVKCGEKTIDITVGDIVINVATDGEGYSVNVPKKYKLNTEANWAPWDFSWSCGELEISEFATDKTLYTLEHLQFWPKDNVTKFEESFDCATWFTTTLWMGTTVVLFYVFILFIAVLYLLDVKSNDRLDDPKGKTITVNVNE